MREKGIASRDWYFEGCYSRAYDSDLDFSLRTLNGGRGDCEFTGKIWSETRLLTIAHAYQQATDWHRRRPNLKMR
jgi:hypothetical protein